MDKQTVVALLRKFNQWRKGEIDQWEAGSHAGPHPREISEAIDAACQMLEQGPAAQPVAVPDDFLPSWASYRQGKEDGKAEATCILHERAEAAIRTLERMGFEWTSLPGSEHMDWYEEAVTREMFPGTYDALEKLSANKRSDSHE